jgi:NAD(P)H-nitrite reductase large subunit
MHARSIVELDDELCLCFHVSKRKVLNFLRIERPRRAGQMSECFGAGTGCGWCRGYLARLFAEDAARRGLTAAAAEAAEVAARRGVHDADDPAAADYARARGSYVREGGGTPPPGATPIE